MTLHRAENVDNKESLSTIIKSVIDSKENIIFPVHPRTFNKLNQFNLYNKLVNSKNIFLLNSVGYFEMLELMKKSMFVITDSGGIQEEITSPKIMKKAIIVRKTTDRPESVDCGLSELVGTTSKKIMSSIKKTKKNPKLKNKKTPYGKGDSSKKISKIMSDFF